MLIAQLRTSVTRTIFDGPFGVRATEVLLYPDFGGIIPILSHQPESRYRVRKNGINPDFQQILPKISMLSRFSSQFKSYFGSFRLLQ